jgi:myo-inositol-1(or 4)-monophosphatase
MRQAEPLSLAIEIAKAAGELLLQHFGEHLAYEEKSSRRADLVTAADRASEQLIVERINAASPGATIVAEESGVHAGYTDERWFVDPLDGTTNFAHTYPLFCVSIACERGGELVAAVVYAPKLGELYAAEKAAGARLGEQPLRVSRVARVADALLCTGFAPSQLENNITHFHTLSKASHAVRRDGAAALDLAFVAAGRFDAFWEFGLSAWDIAAGTLLVREAGGCVTRADGAPLDYFGREILATNGALHDEMRECLGR